MLLCLSNYAEKSNFEALRTSFSETSKVLALVLPQVLHTPNVYEVASASRCLRKAMVSTGVGST